MHHPDLEQKLKDLQKSKVEAVQDLRDLANEAIENADRASKTMMMFLEPAGLNPNCGCSGKFCSCTPPKQRPSSVFIKNVSKAIEENKEK
jgi:hypothetical protein